MERHLKRCTVEHDSQNGALLENGCTTTNAFVRKFFFSLTPPVIGACTMTVIRLLPLGRTVQRYNGVLFTNNTGDMNQQY
jgi:hypothetical protein